MEEAKQKTNGRKLNIIGPDDQMKYQKEIVFRWESVKDAEYTLQISNSPDFKEKIEYSGIKENSFEMNTFPDHFRLFYWRVKANVTDWSEVRKFYTDFDWNNALAIIYDPNFSNTWPFDHLNWHGDTVAEAFIKRYAELSGLDEHEVRGRVPRVRLGDIELTVLLAKAKELDIPAVVQSTTGVAHYSKLAAGFMPEVQLFMPLGSNNRIELKYFGKGEFSTTVISGAGDAEMQNNTAFGNGLEFWDTDYELEDRSGDRDASSYSNGVVAATLLWIKQQRNCSWWEARYCAWKTGDPWTKENGFGKIKVADAISYSGKIPEMKLNLDVLNDRKYFSLSAEMIDGKLQVERSSFGMDKHLLAGLLMDEVMKNLKPELIDESR